MNFLPVRNRLVEPEGFSPRNRTKMQVPPASFHFFPIIDDGEGAVVTHISFPNLAHCSCQPEQREPDSTVFLNVGGKRFEVGVHHHHHRIQNDHNCCQGPVPLAIIEIIFRSCGTPLASSLSPGLGASMIAQGFKKFPQILQFSN